MGFAVFMCIYLHTFSKKNWPNKNKNGYRNEDVRNISRHVTYIFAEYNQQAALKFGSEAWVLKKREEQRLEAAQMKFLRHLLGITKLDKEKNQCIR